MLIQHLLQGPGVHKYIVISLQEVFRVRAAAQGPVQHERGLQRQILVVVGQVEHYEVAVLLGFNVVIRLEYWESLFEDTFFEKQIFWLPTCMMVLVKTDVVLTHFAVIILLLLLLVPLLEAGRL